MIKTQKFKIQIWFDGLKNKFLLGTVSVYADTEEQAIELAKTRVDYRVSGVDSTSWQVREQAKFEYQFN